MPVATMPEWTVVAKKKKKKDDRPSQTQSTIVNITAHANTSLISQQSRDTYSKSNKVNHNNKYWQNTTQRASFSNNKTPAPATAARKNAVNSDAKMRSSQPLVGKTKELEHKRKDVIQPTVAKRTNNTYNYDVFCIFPYEVVLHVLSFLDVRALQLFSQASTVHYDISIADAIWKPLLLRDWSLKRGEGKKHRRKNRTVPEQGKWRDRYITLVQYKKRAEIDKQKREKSMLKNYSDLFVVRSRLYTVAQKKAD